MQMPRARWLASLLSLAVLALGVWGVVEMWRETSRLAPLGVRVDATERDLGRVRMGQRVALDIVVSNPHSTPRSLIGVGRY